MEQIHYFNGLRWCRDDRLPPNEVRLTADEIMLCGSSIDIEVIAYHSRLTDEDRAFLRSLKVAPYGRG